MPKQLQLPTFTDQRGSLTVIDRILPFEVKRVFYIYNVDDSVRGNHRHIKTVQAAVCLTGTCIVSNDNGLTQEDFLLDDPGKCLLLFPEDYHWMHSFSKGAILMVLASEHYDSNDYIYEGYR